MNSLGLQPAYPSDSGTLYSGISIRALIAKDMLTAIVSGYTDSAKVNEAFIANTEYKELAKCAVELADALLNELNPQYGT